MARRHETLPVRKLDRPPGKDALYLNLAEQEALRSTCHRRNYGAVIVKNGRVIATVSGGAPRGTVACTELRYCPRDRLGARRGENYELCRAVHAEERAINSAGKRSRGGTLYLVGLEVQSKERLAEAGPCPICLRSIADVGISRVVVGLRDEEVEMTMGVLVGDNLKELRKVSGRYEPVMPTRLPSSPADVETQGRLVRRFGLSEAVVVQHLGNDNRKLTIGRAAAGYFLTHVENGNSVALSCGDTTLAMLEHLPYRTDHRLRISQLSVEGDPKTVYQAPITLVGLLRGKSSRESDVWGLQLPPLKLAKLSRKLRQEFMKGRLLAGLKRRALCSDFVFLGVGSANEESASFWAVAQEATGNKFAELARKFGIVGEINNQVYDERGRDRTGEIPNLSVYFVNVLSLQDIRRMAREPRKHKVVMVAGGTEKTEAMRAALDGGLANVLITCGDDADRLLTI
jgi:dCMP deaminase